MEKLKVAFIGGGINSAVGSAHYSAISLDNIFELVAGYFSRHEEINLKSAERYRVPQNRVYNNIDDLIINEKDKIDAVIVLTPTDQHYTQVIKLIDSGLPVICEKSLAYSVSEVKEIEKSVKMNNGFLSVIYNYLGYPIIRELKNMIIKGKLGDINHIQIEMPQEGFIRKGVDNKPIIPQSWRLRDGVVSTLSLDLGVHLHMFIKYLTGEYPLKVVSKSESFGNFSEINDNINCIIEYSNNLTCHMWYSKIAIGNRNGLKIRIYGKYGAAEWVQSNPEILNYADIKGNRYTIDRGNEEVEVCNKTRYSRFKVGHPGGFIEAFANYYYDIANALTEYKKNKKMYFDDCFGIAESLEGIKLFEAVKRSSDTGLWEEISYK